MPNKVIDGGYFNYTFAAVLERQGFRVLADLAKLNIPYQNTALLGLRKYIHAAPDVTERVIRAMSDAVTFTLDPKNKERVVQSMVKGLRPPRAEDALGVAEAGKYGGRTPSGAGHLSNQDCENREGEHEIQHTGNDAIRRDLTGR